jgi:hypothetical protein
MLVGNSPGVAADITVTTNGGSSAPPIAFHYESAPNLLGLTHSGSCTQSSVNLTNCPLTGGGTLAISGNALYQALYVNPAGVCAGAISIQSETVIKCTLSDALSGTTFRVNVTTQVGTTNSLWISYVNTPSPIVSYVRVSPAMNCDVLGPNVTHCNATSAYSLSIFGSLFQSLGSTVNYSLCAAAPTYVNSSLLTCVMAPNLGPGTAFPVVVVNSFGVSNADIYITFASLPIITSKNAV